MVITRGYGQAWQQKTDYRIHCRLDDLAHSLQASIKLVYHNRSPRAMHELKLHTWMNVFKTRPTPYSKQLNALGLDQRLILKKEDEGGYTSLNFSQDGQALNYRYTDHTGEILVLDLKEAIKPGQAATISLEYQLDIPANISRGGHLGQSYQMTQWYPKVVLYDSSGWHEMHYLELGEFYNDFGDFDVTVELPANYIVASTGLLETPEEIEFLWRYADSCKGILGTDLALQPTQYIPSATQYKTLRFRAENVTDFAWFADKRFLVNHQLLELAEKKVDAWTFFLPSQNPVWKSGITYLCEATRYFDRLVGAYPWPQISMVQCERKGTDGMEYPMIALIDAGYNQPASLEDVIVHEAGHNWFQAILATDERNLAWMDEGLVTYYEHRYFRDRPNPGMLADMIFGPPTDYDRVPDFDWYLQANRQRDAPSKGDPLKYSLRGYIQSVYEKPAKGLLLMEKTMGRDSFDQMIQAWFRHWQFRHPGNADFQTLALSNGVSWFHPLYLSGTEKADVAIEEDAGEGFFRVSHNLDFPIPLEYAGFRNGELVIKHTLPPFLGQYTLSIRTDSLDYILLDPDFLLPEINRENNIARIKKSKYTPSRSKLHFIAGLDHSLVKDHYLSPSLGYNYYDGLLAGATLHNLSLPVKTFKYAAMVGYGFQSKVPVWLAGFEYQHFLKNPGIERIDFGMETRHFTFHKDPDYGFTDRYLKLAPVVRLVLRPDRQRGTTKEISYRNVFIHQWYGEGTDFETRTFIRKSRSYSVHELKYQATRTGNLSPFDINITLDAGKGFAKLSGSFRRQIAYAYGPKQHGELHLFTGIQTYSGSQQIYNTFVLNGTTGPGFLQRDYKYDELLLGRGEENKSLSQHIFRKDAHFRTSGQAGILGKWLISGSYRTTLPGFSPIRPYVQMAMAPMNNETKARFFYTTGISLVLINDIFEINFPVFESKRFRDSYALTDKNTYREKCTYLINFKALNPFRMLEKLGQ